MRQYERDQLSIFLVYSIVLFALIVFSFLSQAKATAEPLYPLMTTTREVFVAFALLSFAWAFFTKRKVIFKPVIWKYQIYLWTGIVLIALMSVVVLIHRIETQTYTTQAIKKNK